MLARPGRPTATAECRGRDGGEQVSQGENPHPVCMTAGNYRSRTSMMTPPTPLPWVQLPWSLAPRPGWMTTQSVCLSNHKPQMITALTSIG